MEKEDSTVRSEMYATKYYSQEQDLELMDQVVLYNPFTKANSWEKFRAQLCDNTLADRSSKSMRDRALLLMDQRRRVVAHQEGPPGIHERWRGPLELAIDEAMLLMREAKEQGGNNKRKAETRGDEDTHTAAEKRRPPPQQVEESQPGTSTENSQELTAIMNLKLDEAKRQREEDRKEREEERKLRREELEILRRELTLRENQEKNSREERQLMVQMMQGLVKVLEMHAAYNSQKNLTTDGNRGKCEVKTEPDDDEHQIQASVYRKEMDQASCSYSHTDQPRSFQLQMHNMSESEEESESESPLPVFFSPADPQTCLDAVKDPLNPLGT